MACDSIKYKGVIEMPRYDGTGPHGQCAGNGRGRRLRHRHGQVMGGRFHPAGLMQDHSLVVSGMAKLQSEIEAMQVRFEKLKVLSEKQDMTQQDSGLPHENEYAANGFTSIG